MKLHSAALAALALASGLAAAQNASQGVSKSEVVLGSIQDLSGPIAGFGKQVRLGMMLRADEINEQGGINGRRIKLVIEDSAYDPKKAVLAAQKLVNQDRIFAMIGHIGAAQNMAAMPVQFEKNFINFFPVTAAREMYEPFHCLKYSFAATYYDQMRTLVPKLAKEKRATKVCTMYQDDEFGLEVMRGAEAGLKAGGMELAERTTYKRGATDFSSQVPMDGLYAAHTSQHPCLDDAAQPIRFWANKYKTKFNEDPTVFSVYGYLALDSFARVAGKAGPNLTTESFIKAMDTMVVPGDIFGGPGMKFGPTMRLGNELSRLSQIQDGRWKVVSDYAKP
ncbi:MAG: periplasmic binding domain protein [Ramlibacter sp.]|uniref:ABC transporter substrate-binding protein n=1 Tax=Ramlibacter sp. TaxID=1917967 RepID=UPI00261B1E40|nr:ABC transporter substrate-binding protein [Ramlibacter sp.]MDB5752333.1 periplasmic binding domain protein [Ramlibacter sp.]